MREEQISSLIYLKIKKRENGYHGMIAVFFTKCLILKIMRCIKVKLTGFYIFTIIFFGFFWYTVSSFCAVYENTQIPFIKDSVFSLVLSIILPFFIYFFPTVFRVCALRNKRRNLVCLYKFSVIIPFF